MTWKRQQHQVYHDQNNNPQLILCSLFAVQCSRAVFTVFLFCCSVNCRQILTPFTPILSPTVFPALVRDLILLLCSLHMLHYSCPISRQSICSILFSDATLVSRFFWSCPLYHLLFAPYRKHTEHMFPAAARTESPSSTGFCRSSQKTAVFDVCEERQAGVHDVRCQQQSEESTVTRATPVPAHTLIP